MTDKWISMNDKINKSKKKKAFKHYQVNKKIMNVAKSNSIFLHCYQQIEVMKLQMKLLTENNLRFGWLL